MQPERWERVDAVFAAALEHDEATREAYVAEACGNDHELRDEVASLLRAHRDSSHTTFIDTPVARVRDGDAAGLTAGDKPADALGFGVPESLGPYRLLHRIGSGGMGSVYLGLRADDAYQQRVAVKILRSDLDHDELIRRFRRERQILAHLDHPNIAKLLDGGTTPDGRPYLVMEYVEGLPIDAYCQQAELGIPARLRLFVKVCAAVHLAHQSLVVHRDLKPANILVTAEGEPKLLDFGIAKLLAAEQFPLTVAATVPGLALMTPEYASPEQVRGLEVTTASDVYSLGILLYELLAETRPFEVRDLPADEAMRCLLESTPTRPSAAAARRERLRDDEEVGGRSRRKWTRRIEGDLDTIVLRAMAKDPRRRYPSAEGLAGDVVRHLEGMPVTARGDSFGYMAARFAARHRWAVATSAVALAGLLALTAGLLVQRSATLRERDRAVATWETLVGMLENANPHQARGSEITAREVLDAGLPRIDALADRPALQSDMQVTMGRVYRSLPVLPTAVDLLERGLETRRRLHRGDHADVAEGLELLGGSLRDLDETQRAEELLVEAVAMRRRLHGKNAPEVAPSLQALAAVVHRDGRIDASRQLYAEAVGIRRSQSNEIELAKTLTALGTLEREVGGYGRSEAHFREAAALLEAQPDSESDPDLAWTLSNLGFLLRRQGEYAEADGALARAETIERAVYRDPHPNLAHTLAQRGLNWLAQDRLDEAETCFREALTLRGAVFGEDHFRVADSLNDMAQLQIRRGALEAADTASGRALTLLRGALRPGHRDLAAGLTTRADVLRSQKRCDEAEPLYEEALVIHRQWFGDQHRTVALLIDSLATCVRARGDLVRAIRLREEGIAIFRATVGADHPEMASLLYNLGVTYHYNEQYAEAADRYRQALVIATAKLQAGHGLIEALQAALASAMRRLEG